MSATRIALLVLLAGGLLPLGGLSAHAQDGRTDWAGPAPAPSPRGGDDHRKKKQDDDDAKRKAEEAAKKALEKELDAVATDFVAEATSKLLDRVPKDGSLGLDLGKSQGSYKRKQATGVLDDWFGARTLVSAERKKVTGSTGKFTLKLKNRRSGDKVVEKTLLVTVEKTDAGFRLTQITVE